MSNNGLVVHVRVLKIPMTLRDYLAKERPKYIDVSLVIHGFLKKKNLF